MRRSWLTPAIPLVAALWATQWAAALDEPSKDTAVQARKAAGIAAQLEELDKNIQEKQQEIVSRYNAAKDDASRGNILQEYQDLQAEFAGKYLKVAKLDPKSPEALRALQVVVATSRDD